MAIVASLKESKYKIYVAMLRPCICFSDKIYTIHRKREAYPGLSMIFEEFP
jgi:hypothetical protein